MATAPGWLQVGTPSKAGLMHRIDVLMAALNVVRLLLIKDQHTNVSLLPPAARSRRAACILAHGKSARFLAWLAAPLASWAGQLTGIWDKETRERLATAIIAPLVSASQARLDQSCLLLAF